MAVEKTITIDGIEVKMKASAATPRLYRSKFGRDLYSDFATMQDGSSMNLECIEDIAYIMAKAAEPEAVADDVDEWLSQFGMLSVYMAAQDIISLWGLNTQTLVDAKKK